MRGTMFPIEYHVCENNGIYYNTISFIDYSFKSKKFPLYYKNNTWVGGRHTYNIVSRGNMDIPIYLGQD